RDAPRRLRDGARGGGRVAPTREAMRPAPRPGPELAVPLVPLRREPCEPRRQARSRRVRTMSTRLVPDLVLTDAGWQSGRVVVVEGGRIAAVELGHCVLPRDVILKCIALLSGTVKPASRPL